ncbi:MAG: hypothetical protein ACP5D0_07895 [Hydrogenovibrio sp.]
MDADVLQAAQNTLLDIEVPAEPGVDWWGLLMMFGWGLVGLLIWLLLVWLMWHFGRRWRLRWALHKVVRGLRTADDSGDSGDSAVSKSEPAKRCQAELNRLCHLFQTAVRHRLLPPPSVSALKPTIDQACFSENGVSRETLLKMAQTFRRDLIASTPSFGSVLLCGWRNGFETVRASLRAWRARLKPSAPNSKNAADKPQPSRES